MSVKCFLPLVLSTLLLQTNARAGDGPTPSHAAHPVLPAARNHYVVIAHRGDHVSLPENTLPAYQQGVDDGADYVEVDLRTTRDSMLVVMHNETVDRMTNGKGAIRDMSYATIRGLEIRDAAHNQVVRIPSFEEVLTLCSHKINIYLDFKEADPGMTYAMIKKAGMEKHVVVYANSLEQITAWGKVAPAMPIITSIPDELKDSAGVAAFLDRYPIVGVDGSIGQYPADVYRLFRQRHIAVWLDVQQKDEGPATWEKAMAEKVQGMQSDHPAALVDYLKNAQPSDLKQILNDLYTRPDRILISAHRGDHALFPENSLPAIGKAIDAGVDIVELDIRETRDKVLVLMHDKNIDRTTTGKGAVESLSFQELQGFYLLQDGKPTTEKIPSFEEALKTAKGHILIDIDFKAETQSAKQETYRLLRKYGMEQQVFFFIYDYKEATEYRALDKRVPIMPRAYKNEDVQAILQMGRFPAVHVDETFYSDTLMGRIRAAGMRVWINALGKYDDLEEKAVASGSPGGGFASLLKNASQANFIQTNYPEQLLAWLRKKGLHR